MKYTNYQEIEKWLKRSLKKKISFDNSSVTKYLILGFAGLFLYSMPIYTATESVAGGKIKISASPGGTSEEATVDENEDSIAIGAGSKAEGENSIAVGSSYKDGANTKRTEAKAKFTTVIGAGSKAEHANSIIVGTNSVTGNEDTIIIGNNVITNEAKDRNGNNYTLNGDKKSKGIVVIGNNTRVTTNSDNSVVIGTKASAYDSTNSAVVIGNEATVGIAKPLNPGESAGLFNNQSIAIGNRAQGFGGRVITIGHYSYAGNEQSIAIGTGTKTESLYSSAIGWNATTSPTVWDLNDKPFDLNARGAFHSMAIGNFANVDGVSEAMAIGREASVVRPTTGSASTEEYKKNSIDGAVALGAFSKANRGTVGYYGYVYGYEGSYKDTQFSAEGTKRIGGISEFLNVIYPNQTTRNQMQNAHEAAKRNLESARNASKTAWREYLDAFSAFNGDSRNTNAIKPTEEQLKAKLDAARAAEKAYYLKLKDVNLFSTWQPTHGEIAVGNSELGITRQITGVAAGTFDTDAVNVAQLRRVDALRHNHSVFAADNSTVTERTDTTTNLIVWDSENAFKRENQDNKVVKVVSGDFTGKDNVEYKGKNIETTIVTEGVNKNIGKISIGIKENPEFKSINLVDGNKSVSLTPSAENTLVLGGSTVAGSTIGAPVTIKNIATPTENTDAANKSYVDNGRTKVTSNDKSISINETTGTNGEKIFDISTTGSRYVSINNHKTGGVDHTQDDSVRNVARSNYKNDGATGDSAVAIGRLTTASGDFSTALGNLTTANGEGSTAIGANAATTGANSIAIGSRAQGIAAQGIAIGPNAIVTSENGIALGGNTLANTNSGKIGYDVTVTTQPTGNDELLTNQGIKDEYYAMEADITSKQQDYEQALATLEVAENNNTATENQREEVEKKKETWQAALGKRKLLLSTWKASEGALAIGNVEAGETRQITGVAAGTNDTDAVNVAQLKKLAEQKITFKDGANATFDRKNSEHKTITIKEGDINGTNFVGDNLKVNLDNTNGTFTVGMNKTPRFDGVELGAKPANSATDTDTKIVMKPGADGKLTLEKVVTPAANGGQPGTPKTEKVEVTGIADGTTHDAAVNKTQLDKIENNNPFEYVKKDDPTKELIKLGDNFYEKDAIKDLKYDPVTKTFIDKTTGQEPANPPTVIRPENVAISTKDEVKTVFNVESGIDPTKIGAKENTSDNTKDAVAKTIDPTTAKELINGTNGLNNLTKVSDLNKVATVGDLKTLSIAGLDFTANKAETTGKENKVHRNLGTSIAIEGENPENRVGVTYATTNITTTADEDTNKILVKIAENPRFKEIKLGENDNSTITLTPKAADNTLTFAKETVTPATAPNTQPTVTKTPVELKGVAEGKDKDSAVNKNQLDKVEAASPFKITDKTDPTKELVKLGDNFYDKETIKDLVYDTNSNKFKNPDGTEAQNQPTAVTKDNVVIVAKDDPKQIENVLSGIDPTKIGKATTADATKAEAISVGDAKTLITNLINNDTVKELNKVATVGDLKTLSIAGLDFKGSSTQGETHRNLGTTVNILGNSAKSDEVHLKTKTAADAKTTNDEKSKYYVDTFGKNIITTVNPYKDGEIVIGTVERPEFTGIDIKDGDKSILTIEKDGENTDVNNPTGKITGLTDRTPDKTTDYGKDRTRAATEGAVKDLADKLGLDKPKLHENSEPGKADGLDKNTISEKIDAIREGNAGPIVYTNEAGERLVRGEDGKYYKPSDLQNKTFHKDAADPTKTGYYDSNVVTKDPNNGTTTLTGDPKKVDPEEKIIHSLVNNNGDTKDAPSQLGNVASGIDPTRIGAKDETKTDGSAKAISDARDLIVGNAKDLTNIQDGEIKGLNNLDKVSELNKVATIGDLKTLSIAGFEVGANTGENNNNTNNVTHRNLGERFDIIGKEDVADFTIYTTDNVATRVVSKTADKKSVVEVGILKTPRFDGVELGAKPADPTTTADTKVTLTPSADGKLTLEKVITPAAPAGTPTTPIKDRVELKGIAEGKDKDSAVNKGQLDKVEDNRVFEYVDKTVPADPTNPAVNKVTKLGDTYYNLSKLPKEITYNPATGKFEKQNPDGTKTELDSNSTELDPAEVKKENVEIAAKDDAKPINNVLSGIDPTKIGAKISDTDKSGNAKPLDVKDAQRIITGKNSDGTDDNNIKGLNELDKLSELNKVATVGDLKTLSIAGLDFGANTGLDIHRNLGERLFIIGNKNIISEAEKTVKIAMNIQGDIPQDRQADFANNLKAEIEKNYSNVNVVTVTDPTTNSIVINIAKKPEFEEVKIKDDKGNAVMTIGKDSNSPVDKPTGKITGLTERTPDKLKNSTVPEEKYGEGENAGRAATEGAVKELADAIGHPSGKTHTPDEAGGKDNLDTKPLIDKVETLREGSAGPVVYTNEAGDRLVRGEDGKYYKSTDIENKIFDKASNKYYPKNGNGQADMTQEAAKPAEKVLHSLVNADGTTTNPSKLTNVDKGTISSTSKDAINGSQLDALGKQLGLTANADKTGFETPTFIPLKDEKGNDVAEADKPKNMVEAINKTTETVNKGLGYGSDLVAASDDTKQHLGSNVSVTTNKLLTEDGKNFGGENIVTSYEKDTTTGNGTISIAIKDKPTFTGIELKERDTTDNKFKTDAYLTIEKDSSQTDPTVDATKPSGKILGLTERTVEKLKNVTNPTDKYGEGVNAGRAATEGAVKELADAIGHPSGKTHTPDEAGGKDNLDTKPLIDKVETLREGSAGPVVYTNEAGDRLVRGEDGKYYKSTDIENKIFDKASNKYYPKNGNGQADMTQEAAKPAEKVLHSLVNADGTTTNPSKLGNIAGGSVSPTSNQAVNGKQLHQSEENSPFTYKDKDGNKLTKLGNKYYDLKNLTYDLPSLEYNVDGEPIFTGENTAIANAPSYAIDDPNVVIEQKDKGKQITGVASGIDPTRIGKETDAKDGKALEINPETAKAILTGKDKDGNKVLDGNNKEFSGLNNFEKVSELNKVATVGDLKTLSIAGLDFGANAGEDIHRNLGEKVSIVGDNTKVSALVKEALQKEGKSIDDKDAYIKMLETIIAENYSSTNVVTSTDPNTNSVVIHVAKRPEFTGVDIKDEAGNSVLKIEKDNTNPSNQATGKITGLTDRTPQKTDDYGVDPGRVATEGAVKEVAESIRQSDQKINSLGEKVNQGLANAAAMAGVQFMEIGINQATVAAAIGGFEGTQAVAVGIQGAFTENTRVNAKVSLSPGRNTKSMYSIGAAYRFNLK